MLSGSTLRAHCRHSGHWPLRPASLPSWPGIRCRARRTAATGNAAKQHKSSLCDRDGPRPRLSCAVARLRVPIFRLPCRGMSLGALGGHHSCSSLSISIHRRCWVKSDLVSYRGQRNPPSFQSQSSDTRAIVDVTAQRPCLVLHRFHQRHSVSTDPLPRTSRTSSSTEPHRRSRSWHGRRGRRRSCLAGWSAPR